MGPKVGPGGTMKDEKREWGLVCNKTTENELQEYLHDPTLIPYRQLHLAGNIK